jgi:hypothetical protein
MVTIRGVRLGLAVVFAGLAGGLVACESTVVRQGDGDGGGGSGGGVTTTRTTATGGAGGGSTTTSSTSTTSGDLCAPFADEHGTSSVTVRFRNDTGMPLYLPAGCSSVQYTIKPLGGDDPSVSYAYENACLQTCQDLWTSPPYACGACAPTTYLVEPGATRDVIWNGTGLTYSNAMPSECYAYPNSWGCSRVVAAPPGAYVVDALGYSACEGDCTCDANGVCYGYVNGAQAYPDPVTLSYPGDSLAEVVFGPCAFGCAEPLD